MIGIITSYKIGKTFHSKYSGYERLLDYMQNSNIYYTSEYRRISFLLYPLRALRVLPKLYATFKAELDCLKQNDKIFHLYGEETFFLSGFKLFRENKKIVVTFHQPEKFFKKYMPFFWKFLLRDVDIIVLSPSQKKFFQKNLPKNRVYLIPHGIDTKYFKPDPKIKKKNQIIAVGRYLRDYSTLLKAMELVKENLPDLKLITVAKECDKKYDANYEFKTYISDSRLLRLYRESLFQVLPLKDVTANNALLEGCACGLPLISINSENIKYYFEDAITYEDYSDLASKIIWTYDNLDKFKVDISKLSWENIAKKIKFIIGVS